MAFQSKQQVAQQDESDAAEIREILEQELGDLGLESSAETADDLAVVDDGDAPLTARGRADKKVLRRVVIGGVIAIGIIYLLDRWLNDPALQKPERVVDPQIPDEPIDAEPAIVDVVDISLDAIGYSVDGERVSAIGDGTAAFLLAAALPKRGVVPGTTVVRLDFTEAPHGPAAELEQALRERGYEITITRASGAGRG